MLLTRDESATASSTLISAPRGAGDHDARQQEPSRAAPRASR